MRQRRQDTFYYIVRTIACVVSKLYFRLEVKGKENIKLLKGPFILASNHQSFLDPIVLAAASTRSLKFIAREDLFRNFIFGNFISCVGAISVNLERLSIGLVKKIYSLFKEGRILVIFPEGTRSPEGVIGKARPGIGYLFDKTKVCVVPAFIDGSSRAWPRYSLWIKPRKIKVTFGEVIKWESLGNSLDKEFPKDKYKQIADFVMDRIRELSMR